MEQNGKRRRRLLGRKKNNRFWDSLLSVVIFSIGLGGIHTGHFNKNSVQIYANLKKCLKLQV